MKIFKIPKFVRFLFPKRVWGFSVSDKRIFLTFDDGPHPSITPFVLDELAKRNLKATFFCVGANVEKYPIVYKRILAEGHAVGNHTMRHENGKKTNSALYFSSIENASTLIESTLFRPPYGRIRKSQVNELAKKYRIIMWTWLSYDYDQSVSVDQILLKAEKIKSGDILVLHDNSKIVEKQQELLPKLLEKLLSKGFTFSTIKD